MGSRTKTMVGEGKAGVSKANVMDSYLKTEEEKKVQVDSEISALNIRLPFVKSCPWPAIMLNTLYTQFHLIFQCSKVVLCAFGREE